MPTSITILDSKNKGLTTIFFTKAVYKYLQENSGFLVKNQSFGAPELEAKYDELRKVDEEALKFTNMEQLKSLDAEFFSAYWEVKEAYKKNNKKFTQKLFNSRFSKHYLKIASGDESFDIMKLNDKEKLHVFVLDDLYRLWDKEGVAVSAAKEFLKKSSEPYTIARIFGY